MRQARSAGLVVIGDEVLKGKCQDLNTAFATHKLWEKVSILPCPLLSVVWREMVNTVREASWNQRFRIQWVLSGQGSITPLVISSPHVTHPALWIVAVSLASLFCCLNVFLCLCHGSKTLHPKLPRPHAPLGFVSLPCCPSCCCWWRRYLSGHSGGAGGSYQGRRRCHLR